MHPHYRSRLGDAEAFDNRLFDPAGLRAPIWFQAVPPGKGGKNRVHVDAYPTTCDHALTQAARVARVDARVDDPDAGPDDPYYDVVMQDPEGNEFCVS